MICNQCNTEKDISDFEHQKNRPNPRKTCKQCRYEHRDKKKEKARHVIYMRERRKNDPDAVRRNWERSVYGACKEDFSYQECFICGSKDNLCIDHDHNTGKVRGLLCRSCNFAIAHFEDDHERMDRAIKYLKDGPHWQLPWRQYPV